MTRLRQLSEEEAPAQVQRHFQRDRDTFGTVLPGTGVYAHCPPIMDAAKAMGRRSNSRAGCRASSGACST